MNQRFCQREFKAVLSQIFARAWNIGLDHKSWADAAGLCPQTIKRLESGKTQRPYYDTIQRMAYAAGMDVWMVVKDAKRQTA